MDDRPLVMVDLDGVLWRFLLGLSVNFRRKSIPATRPQPRKKTFLRRLVDTIYWWPPLWGPPLRRINYEVAAAIGTNSNGDHRFLAVTNRPLRLYRVTHHLLGLAGLPDLPVRYNGSGLPSAYFKLEEAQRSRASLFVEDDLAIANFLAQSGITVFLLDRPYNRGEVEPNVFRTGDRNLANLLEGTIRLLRPS